MHSWDYLLILLYYYYKGSRFSGTEFKALFPQVSHDQHSTATRTRYYKHTCNLMWG